MWFQNSGFLLKKSMQLFDIRSDRQIIALAIKAFRIRNERRNYLKNTTTHTQPTNPPGLSWEALVCVCFIVSLHRNIRRYISG